MRNLIDVRFTCLSDFVFWFLCSSSQLLESLPLPNIKWICPTAPTRPVAILGGFPCTAWFDVGELSEDGPDDWEGLDASASHIANLLSTEPADG
ncbi:acyl-protein thioesterase 2-like, partial [Trifolium medium]|nr:acyl-protein thioesterase 2-like [Trifolium medium]